MIKRIKERIKELWEHRKWKLHLYYNGILIKTLKVNEYEQVQNKTYAIRVFNKKFLFGGSVASVVVKPVVLLKTDEIKHRFHCGVVLEQGVSLK